MQKLKEVELRFALLKSQLLLEENRLRRLIPPPPTHSSYPVPYAHLQGNGADPYDISGYLGVTPDSLGSQMQFGVQGQGQTPVIGSVGTPSYGMGGVAGQVGGYGGGLEYPQPGEVMTNPSYNQTLAAMLGGNGGGEPVYQPGYVSAEYQGVERSHGQNVSYQGVGGYGGASWETGEEGKSNGYKFSYGVGYQSWSFRV